MKNRYVADFAVNDELSGEVVVVKSLKKNETKNGGEYYKVEFSDKSGTVNGNIWGDNIPNCESEALVEGAIVKVWGKVEDYKGAKQLKVTSMGIATDYDSGDLMAVSDRDPADMWKAFGEHIKGLEDVDIKELLIYIFSDENLKKQYQEYPAAERVHHGYKHGLLEHVLEMLDLSTALLHFYPVADISLVKAGCILHDIGKLEEMSYTGLKTDKTDIGLLMGHIVLGTEFLTETVKRYNNDRESKKEEFFPEDKLLKLKHIILSHHGILEYGSPVVPMTIEAAIVSSVDDASAKVRQYQRILAENGIVQSERIKKESTESTQNDKSAFSERDNILGTRIYLK